MMDPSAAASARAHKKAQREMEKVEMAKEREFYKFASTFVPL
jgi:hypothetical protein